MNYSPGGGVDPRLLGPRAKRGYVPFTHSHPTAQLSFTPPVHRPMTFALCYWILMLIWLVFGLWTSGWNPKASGGNLLLFVLLVLVGWKLFGAPVHG